MSTEIDLATELAAVKAQLKEQTQQMAEMASMMKSMMSLAMPLLEEQARKLRNEKEAEAARKKAVEELESKSRVVAEQLVKERIERQAERAAKIEADKVEAAKAAEQFTQVHVKKVKAECSAKPCLISVPDWSCPDGNDHCERVHNGIEYITFEGGVWEYNNKDWGKWVGQWDWSTKTIDTTMPEPEFEE
jgi:Fe2+ transport system protein B